MIDLSFILVRNGLSLGPQTVQFDLEPCFEKIVSVSLLGLCAAVPFTLTFGGMDG